MNIIIIFMAPFPTNDREQQQQHLAVRPSSRALSTGRCGSETERSRPFDKLRFGGLNTEEGSMSHAGGKARGVRYGVRNIMIYVRSKTRPIDRAGDCRHRRRRKSANNGNHCLVWWTGIGWLIFRLRACASFCGMYGKLLCVHDGTTMRRGDDNGDFADGNWKCGVG